MMGTSTAPGPATLWHPVPRLDAPDKFWIIPRPVAMWLLGGALSGPAYAQLAGYFGGHDLAMVALVWALGVLLGCVGAFVRPQGLHLGQWASAVVAYALVPRRAVWCPVPERMGGRG